LNDHQRPNSHRQGWRNPNRRAKIKYTIKTNIEKTFAVEAESPQAALRLAKKTIEGPDGKVWVMMSAESGIAVLAAFKSNGQWRNF
jgi:hypothetical protein